jgi:DNA-binding GntR family transcriptional regulator
MFDKALEIVATNWAMQSSYVTLIQELTKNISDSEEKITVGDFYSFADLDAQFHETIARLSKSRHIMELTQLMRRPRRTPGRRK